MEKVAITKRKIQYALGVLWLLDGLLQLQHQMFSAAFANNVILPASMGQPPLVSGPAQFGAKVILTHPAVFDAFFATIQILIGLLILNKKYVRRGLILSCFWGLGVWLFGESLGGILSGNTNLLMGAPGAVILYVILALAVMPRLKHEPEDNRPAFWLPLVWSFLWIAGGIYQLLPGQNTTQDLSSMINTIAQGAPGWMASTDTWFANQIAHASFWLIAVIAAVEILIGLMVLIPGVYRGISLVLGSSLALVFWVIGQSMGSYFSGLMTDPNSGPLFVLLAIAILGCPAYSFHKLRKDGWKTLENFMT
ncbi:MAG TPA: hypothetical protein VL989_03145 [Candidatus Sulfotelmatobacter sp.]|nr:hypothetical protein [Candidatus Sulfotelmatobacter sp.]